MVSSVLGKVEWPVYKVASRLTCGSTFTFIFSSRERGPSNHSARDASARVARPKRLGVATASEVVLAFVHDEHPTENVVQRNVRDDAIGAVATRAGVNVAQVARVPIGPGASAVRSAVRIVVIARRLAALPQIAKAMHVEPVQPG